MLVPIFRHPDDGEWHVVFTRRTETVDSHKGQVSFPGGRSDPHDADRVATALREAHEEIGLAPGDVQVIGTLDELLTVSQYRVTPIVGLIPWPYPFRLSPGEVAEVFDVPFAWLADPVNVEEQWRPSPINGRPILWVIQVPMPA